jgi:acyl-CoA reductase-like NAD-dependent aldehyde dehydrogenase
MDRETLLKGLSGVLWVNGEAQPAEKGAVYDVLEPATAHKLVEAADASSLDVERAVEAATAALRSSGWAEQLPYARGSVLRAIANRIRDRADELAELETINNGQPIKESRGQVLGAAILFDYYAGLAPSVRGTTIPMGPGVLDYTLREPFGICGMIVPWNAPIFTVAMKLAPALATGNAAIVKPSPLTPLTALRLAELAHEAGLPDGLLSVLPGSSPELGSAIVTHPEIPRIAFTGSTATGRKILEAAAPHIKNVSLEMGGKSPNIILPDADLDAAIEGSVYFSMFRSAGQICTHRTRTLIPASIYDDAVERYVNRAKQLNLGDPLEESTEMGPLVSADQLDRTRHYIGLGIEAGATVALGGVDAPEGFGDGWFMAPTVLTDVTNEMAVARDEIFGPVAALMSYADVDEAVEIANDTSYGLAATVWTGDLALGHRVAARLQAGNVSINQAPVIYPWSPFAGYKQSGLGVEMGVEALDEYVQIKNVMAKL